MSSYLWTSELFRWRQEDKSVCSLMHGKVSDTEMEYFTKPSLPIIKYNGDLVSRFSIKGENPSLRKYLVGHNKINDYDNEDEEYLKEMCSNNYEAFVEEGILVINKLM